MPTIDPQRIVGQITTDHLSNRSLLVTFKVADILAPDIFGYQNYEELELTDERSQFRLFDDDDELYYSGWLMNDDLCATQETILSWAMHDSGCTRIKVRRGNEWVQEIA